jgi:hypothetical protein
LSWLNQRAGRGAVNRAPCPVFYREETISAVNKDHDMKKPESKMQAVMNVGEGETIAGMWASPRIPEIGVYKLTAKKRKNGTYEWVHFQHRLDGTRKVLFRGEVETKARIADVLEAANKTLNQVYGVTMSVADYDVSALNARTSGDIVH